MTEYIGPNGRAVQLEIKPELKNSFLTTTWWLLTGSWHPMWSQFILSVVSLEDGEGEDFADLPEANLHFPGATHELLVCALNPGNPPVIHSKATLEEGGLAAVGGFLSPVDVVHQFTATDEEMIALADLCAAACTNGILNPSTDDARAILRQEWLSSCVRTLAHMRGEEHAP